MNKEIQAQIERFRKDLNKLNLPEEDKAELLASVKLIVTAADKDYNEYLKEVEEERQKKDV